MQSPLTPIQQKLLHTICPVCEIGELSEMDSIAPDAPFLYCGHCETTIDGAGTVERGNGTTEYLYVSEICSSSLDEWGWPITQGETAHKWDESSNPIECAECGTLKDQQ